MGIVVHKILAAEVKSVKNATRKLLVCCLLAALCLACLAFAGCGIKCKVYFHFGYEGAEDQIQEVPFGERIKLLPAERPDYTFLGWFKDQNFSQPAKEEAPWILTSIHLYAKWQANPVQLQIATDQTFYQGDSVFTDHFTATVTYADGTAVPTDQFHVLLNHLGPTAGDFPVEFSYTENNVTVKTTFTITIHPLVVESISAQYVGHDVAAGTTLDETTLVVTARYNNGTSQQIEAFRCSYDFSQPNDQSVVTVFYTEDENIFCTVTVPVKEAAEVPVSLQVVHDGTVFTVGDAFRPTTLLVTVTFADDHTETLNSKQYSYSGFSSKKAGQVDVTVTYKWLTQTVQVTVQNTPLVAIEAKYVGRGIEVGDQLNFDDFVVTATYEGDYTAQVENFNVGNFSSEKAGTLVLEISYTEGDITLSCTLSVTVVEKGTLANGNVSVHFLELGNKFTGDCVYIKAGETDILIDAGSKNNSAPVITAYLDQFVTDNTLEYVIATHAHEDHIAGFYSEGGRTGVFDHFQTEVIIEFALTNKTSTSTNTVYGKYIEARNNEVADGAVCYTAAQCFNEEDGAQRVYQITEDISLEILYNYYYFNTQSYGENDYSVCVMLHQGENNYLFTGDMEDRGEKRMVEYYNNQNTPLPKCLLYKAGHHGSGTSSSPELMEAIQPEYVCVCCCCGTSEYTDNSANQFPTQEFINNIAPYTDKVYVTTMVDNYVDKNKWDAQGTVQSMNGNIVFTCANGVVSVQCSNNNTLLKDTAWFKQNRTCPSEWQQ